MVCAAAAVGLIGQGNDRVLIAPNGIERDIAGDLDVVIGLVFDSAVFALRPAEEHLALGRGEAERFNAHGVGHCIDGVFPGVRFGLLTVIIRHGALALVGEVRIERCVAVNLGVEVERGAVVGVGRPTSEHPVVTVIIRVRQRELIKLVPVDGPAVRNRELQTGHRARHVDIYCARVFGLCPLSINSNTVGGHGLAGKAILRCPVGVGIPTFEVKVFHSDRLRVRRIVPGIGDALLIFI